MKKRQLFLGLATIAAAVFSFSSCSQDELSTAKAETPDLGQEILLSTNFSTTRSVSQNIQNVQIASGIQVGTFITTTGSTTGFVTNGNNKPFTADGSGGLTVSGDKVYYPNNANADIYAYAPYQSGWNVTDVNADQNFTVQADQSSDDNYKASDLIWATPLTNKESSTSALELAFAHMLSKINVNITNNRTGLSLKGAQIFILNTKPTAPFNLKTGALGTASGSVTEITAATLATGETEPTATASAIIVPQTLAAGTNFIKIVTDATYNNSVSTTLYAKLGANGKSFASAKQYSFTVTINQLSVELSLGGTTISAWTDDNNENVDAEDAIVAGDYVLNDGTLVHKNNLTDAQKSSVRAIVFTNSSSELSAEDQEAGYIGYAMSVKSMGSKSWKDNDSHEDAPSDFAASLAMINGRTKTDALKTAWSENMDGAIVNFTNFTSSSNPLDANAIVGAASGNRNLSGWFAPAFGQMVQILNNLGNAEITNALEVSWSASSGNFYTSSSPSSVLSTINGLATALNQSAIFSNGTVFTTVTENGTNFFYVKVNDAELNYGLGKTAGKGNGNRTVLPILAFKLPQ